MLYFPRRETLKRAAISALLSCSAGLLIPATAHADDVPDTVMLANGGRLRGVVIEEDPQKGITMKLGDGTIRKLSPKDVKEVTYGGSAAPPPAPVPVVAQPAPVAALPPMGMAPNMGMAPTMVMTPNGYVMVAPRQPLRRQSGGLYATGLVFVILGSIMLPVGGVAVAGGAANGQCQHDSTAPCGAGAALLIGGSIFLGSGIAMAVVGGHRVPDDGSALQKASPWWRPTDVAVSPTGSRLTWQF